jgi:hypothetical protein
LDLEVDPSTSKYREWQRGANNTLCQKNETADPSSLLRWANKLAPHAERHLFMPHNVACAFALGGDQEAAFRMCELAIRQGYPDVYRLPYDKMLVSLKNRLERLVAERPRWRTTPAPSPGWAYTVNVNKSGLSEELDDVPPMLDELAHFLAYTIRGSVGVEHFAYGPIAEAWRSEVPVWKHGLSFFELGEGSEVCYFDLEDVQPVVLLGGEGEVRVLGSSLENFLLDWANQQTGVDELDEAIGNARYENFRGYLAMFGVARTEPVDIDGDERLRG